MASVVISTTIPIELIDKVDKAKDKLGFKNYSEYLRHIIKKSL